MYEVSFFHYSMILISLSDYAIHILIIISDSQRIQIDDLLIVIRVLHNKANVFMPIYK